MDTTTIKNVTIGVGIGLALAAYLHHEQKEKEDELRRTQIANIEDRKILGPAPIQLGTDQHNALASHASAGRVQEIPTQMKPAKRFRLTQLVSRAEQCFPNAIATINANSNKPRTYSEFGRRVRSAAAGFVQELGVKPGDRMAILAMNSAEYLECFFSTSFAGALLVPLNIRLSVAELVDTLQDCACKFLIVDEPLFAYVNQLRESVKSLQHVIVFGAADQPAPVNSVALETLIEQHKPLAEAIDFEGCDGIPADTFGLFYTGGTTGKAKGVMLTHEGLMFNAYTITNMVRYQEGVKYLHATSMFHLASGTAIFGVTMMGGTHVFIPKFTPDGVLRTIQEVKITHCLLVPSMFQLLLSVANLSDFDLRSVRYFNYGGSPMLEKVLQGAMKAFPGAKFVQGYGMTETSPLMTFLGADHHILGSPLLTSVGQCVPHGELKIMDENGHEVPRGQVGEICFRGPNVMAGYYNRPETTESTLRDGWLRTGDGGTMNEQGFVFICDRIKDTIVTAGESVYSQEVENCISKLDGILQCAVIGIPDQVLVEKVAAIIVVKKGTTLTEEKIMEHCRARIARYKCPRVVMFRTEALPMSGAGKVLKSVLRDPFWKDVPNQNVYAKSDNVTSTYDNANGK